MHSSVGSTSRITEDSQQLPTGILVDALLAASRSSPIWPTSWGSVDPMPNSRRVNHRGGSALAVHHDCAAGNHPGLRADSGWLAAFGSDTRIWGTHPGTDQGRNPGTKPRRHRSACPGRQGLRISCLRIPALEPAPAPAAEGAEAEKPGREAPGGIAARPRARRATAPLPSSRPHAPTPGTPPATALYRSPSWAA
jgi:hypothetical protein